MPNPHKGESEQDFVSRYVSDPEAVKDFPDKDQRLAVAYSTYKEQRNDSAKDRATQAITSAEKRIAELKDKPKTKDNLERIKQYEEQIAYLKSHMTNATDETWEDMDDQARGIILAIMGQPAKPVTNSRGQSGRVFPMRFIEPGLVHYNDVGTVLVGKEALDRMANSFVGKPIFNEGHKEVTRNDFTQGKADGVIGRVWYDANDGWFWADAIVWDAETVQNIKNGYSLSCAYDVPQEAWGPGGLHNNIPYDREVLNGEYTHLAIVPNPRYERARIIYNQGGHMKLKFWQKDKADEPREMELVNAMTDLNGKDVAMETVIELANAELKRQDELKNAKATDDSIIEVGGRKMTVKEAKELAAQSLQNASEADMKEAHKDGKHDEKDMENCPMCNSRKEQRNAEEKEKEEKEKKDKEEMENTLRVQEHERGSHKEKALENCLSCKSDKARSDAARFEELKNAARDRNGEFKEPNLSSTSERVAEGSKRYGTK